MRNVNSANTTSSTSTIFTNAQRDTVVAYLVEMALDDISNDGECFIESLISYAFINFGDEMTMTDAQVAVMAETANKRAYKRAGIK